MKAIIIEDEKKAITHLKHQLALSGESIQIIQCLSSVEESIDWLTKNETELIFMDIQLGDGLSFEIFDHVQVKAPVIFTTSYNQYALKAFEKNGIAYLLKPIKVSSLVLALKKLHLFAPTDKTINEQILPLHNQFLTRLLVQSGNSLLPLLCRDIAYFRIHDGRHLLVTANNKQQFLVDNKLEIMEIRLDPSMFFRINRQYIINIESIKEIQLAENGKLKLNLNPEIKEEIIVSKEKAGAFKNWIEK